jgi:hypothetical protein
VGKSTDALNGARDAPPTAGIRSLAANPTTRTPGFRTETELLENDRQREGV